MELSWIQRHALMILLRKETARVKELLPPDVAANLFSYHLDGLVSAGIIEKAARGSYTLTTKGQKFAGTFSTLTEKRSEEMKTVVMLYGKKAGKYLLFRWSRQPYIGKVTLLHDRMPFGKTLTEAIYSATTDKLGVDSDLIYRVSALVRIMHNDQQVSHMNALIYEINLDNVTLPFTSRNGEAFLDSLENQDAMSGLKGLITHIENQSAAFDVTLEY